MPKVNPMSLAHLHEVEPETEEISGRQLWDAAVGRVFKLASQNYGVRNVTYTQVKAVRDAAPAGSGAFDIEVLCMEVTARTLSSKRTQSNICKEGVLRQEADTELLPESFGIECPLEEFERLANAILAYTNSYLDWAMQPDLEKLDGVDAQIDLPCLVLSNMEASLVRNSPFLAKNLYFLSANSIAVAQLSIQQELERELRGMLLADEIDASYVAQKNEAMASLQAKLKVAAQEAEARRILAIAASGRDPKGMISAPADAAGSGRRTVATALRLDSLTMALLGKPSATSVRWARANPSEEGPIYCIGRDCAQLDFVRWAHVSGRVVPEAEAQGHQLREFFKGYNQAYTGPDRDGIYPLLKPAAN
jgi:hypothetical protein